MRFGNTRKLGDLFLRLFQFLQATALFSKMAASPRGARVKIDFNAFHVNEAMVDEGIVEQLNETSLSFEVNQLAPSMVRSYLRSSSKVAISGRSEANCQECGVLPE